MTTYHLDRPVFAFLHQKIVETSFPDPKEREEMQEKTEAFFYGFGQSKEEDGISQRMMKKLGLPRINGRALYNLKTAYNRGEDPIPISPKLLSSYLNFVEIEQDELTVMTKEFQNQNPAFPPEEIRKNKYHKTAVKKATKVLELPASKRNLDNFCKNKWWFYFFEYEKANRSAARIIRLIFTITKDPKNNHYAVELKNSGPPYKDFSGTVTHSEDDLVICELKAKKKSMFLLFSIEETGQEELYAGIYLKHDSNSKIYSGSVVLHRIAPGENPTPVVEIFDYDSEKIKKAPLPIVRFFENKNYTFLKTPRRFNLSTLEHWIDEKKHSRGELKEFDLFVSATVISMKEKKESLDRINLKIKKAVHDFILDNFGPSYDQKMLSPLIHRIEEIQLEDPANRFPAAGIFSGHLLFDQEVKKMIKGLGEEIDEISEDKIIYSFNELREGSFLHMDPKYLLERDFDRLKRSKAFLLITPYNRVFSSCWVLIGAAIMMKMPIFIVYVDDDNLPYILREASVMPKIYMKKLKQRASLQPVVAWFRQSGFGKYFR